jgi:amino acid permease
VSPIINPPRVADCAYSGVPIYCVLVTSSISLLTYMTVSVAGTTVFLWVSTVQPYCGKDTDKVLLVRKFSYSRQHVDLDRNLRSIHPFPQSTEGSRPD